MITTEIPIYDIGLMGYREYIKFNDNVTAQGAWEEAARRAQAQIDFLKRDNDKLHVENEELRRALYQKH